MMTACSRRQLLLAMIAVPFAMAAGVGSAEAAPDCSAAVQRVLAQTKGELLSVSVAKSGGQDVCRVTVLANDSSGNRRRKVTVNAKP
ncbi:MAG: hypothetical protein NXI27_23780 [Alphaproteobacteria bacterium]|nr:hypothetical protein [Alphaproteobacteria bacterium]